VGLTLCWLLLLCAPALAHATLLKEWPASGARLDKPPEQVRLQFNEPVEAVFDPLQVYNAEGGRVDRDNPRIDPNDARVLLVDLKELSEGSYRVEWRVTSIDGHPIDGSYEFATTASSTGDAQGEPRPANAENGRLKAEETSSGLSTIVFYRVLGVAVVALLEMVALLRR